MGENTSVPAPEWTATTRKQADDRTDRWVGDWRVPLASALGRHRKPEPSVPFPEFSQWIDYSTNHLKLLNRPEAYQQISCWLASRR
jgi:hypothetical protein